MKSTLTVRLLSLALLGFMLSDGSMTVAQQAKTGLTEADRAYQMPDGVTAKDVTFYSEHVACYAKLFFPKGFSATRDPKYPGVVLAAGWADTSATLEKYAARFADRGLVAMAIDYRGWGKSGGFVRLAETVHADDRLRFHPNTVKVTIKRTRLLPEAQIEDLRNAISYLQGEAGVNRDQIGLWGTGFAGGHVITLAARDARVKAGVCQAPAIAGKDAPREAFTLTGPALADAIQRARTGKSDEYETGDSIKRKVDTETRQATAEYQPFLLLGDIPDTVGILLVLAEKDEANRDSALAASKALKGPTKVVELPGTHFDAYIGDNFEKGANAAAQWFVERLK